MFKPTSYALSSVRGIAGHATDQGKRTTLTEVRKRKTEAMNTQAMLSRASERRPCLARGRIG